MILTSYRAAPPRDKPLRALPKNRVPKRLGQRASAPINPVRRLPEKATLGKCPWVRAVCTNAGALWKGPRAIFSGFYDGQNPPFRAKCTLQSTLARTFAKAQPSGQEFRPMRRAYIKIWGE